MQKTIILIVILLLHQSASTAALNEVTISGKIGNVNSQRVQIITLTGGSIYVNRSMIAESKIKPNADVVLTLSQQQYLSLFETK